MLAKGNQFSTLLFVDLYAAYLQAMKNKKHSYDVQKFEHDYHKNLERLFMSLVTKTYEPVPGIAFVVCDPKVREVFAASFRDRVIHHYIFNKTYKWWDKRFINDSYSCREGKGTLYGVLRLQKMMRRVEQQTGERAWVLTLDLQNFFMSMDRELLYKRALWGLNLQYTKHIGKDSIKGAEYDLLKFLWRQIIFNDPTIGVRIKGRKEDWAKLPPHKSLFNQLPGIGIVIGNLTSQLLSNIFLDQLDRFVMYTLGYRNYGRYVDDFFVVVPESEVGKLKGDIAKIEEFLSEIGLTLHPKKRYLRPADYGIGFLGKKVFPDKLISGSRVTKKFKKSVFNFGSEDISEETLQSYLGMFSHTNDVGFTKKVFQSVGWEYRPSKW